MSYVIHFIKSKNLTINEAYSLLESESNSESETFVSKGLMSKIITQIKSQGLAFELFEDKKKDHFELTFSSYQLAMFNSEIALAIPYWDENSNEGINKEIKLITNILIDNGFTGFDSQTEEFITKKHDISTNFVEAKTVVDNNLDTVNTPHKDHTFLYTGLGLGGIIVLILLWKLLK